MSPRVDWNSEAKSQAVFKSYEDNGRNMGSMYNDGKGVVKDEKVAFDCFFKAAKAKDPEAQHYLAHMFYEGRGTDKSMKDCAYWTNQAHVNGSQKAKKYWDHFELWKYLV